MRFYWLAVLCAASLAGCDGSDHPSAEPPPEPLWEMAGRDLSTLGPDEQARLDVLLAALPPLDGPDGDWWPDALRNARAHYLWRHEWEDGTRVVIHFQGVPYDDSSAAAVRFLDPAGRQLAAVPFYAGRGFSQTGEGAFRQDPTFGPVLEIRLTPGPKIADRRPLRQVYAIRGTGLALIRLEVGAGELIPNNYVHPYVRIGPVPPTRGAAEWAAALASRDSVEPLAALIWLGGHHYVGGDSGHPGAENEAAVKRVQVVRRDLRVRAEVRRLAVSDQPWFQEAAKAAIAREDE